jgi:hypothetical protein
MPPGPVGRVATWIGPASCTVQSRLVNPTAPDNVGGKPSVVVESDNGKSVVLPQACWLQAEQVHDPEHPLQKPMLGPKKGRAITVPDVSAGSAFHWVLESAAVSWTVGKAPNMYTPPRSSTVAAGTGTIVDDSLTGGAWCW